MSEIFYRFRSTNKLIGEFKELDKQSIYFAHPDQLNDPMEGVRDIFWSGDPIAWKNLFKHYLLCLERLCSLLIISGEQHPISKNDMPIFSGENDFPTDQYNKLFSEISSNFFKNKSLLELIEKISSRSTPIRENELFLYLKSIHPLALTVISKTYIKHGLQTPKYKTEINGSEPLNKLIETDLIGILEQALEEKKYEQKITDAIFFSKKSIDTQIDLIERYNGHIKPDRTNKNLVLVDFPEEYISQIKKLVFPEWYTACFMSDCKNSSVWGHYGDNHKGICLMFTAEKEEKYYSIATNGVIGYGKAGPIPGTMKHLLYPIDYVKGYGKIDFFRSLGSLPVPTLNAVWYTDENGNQSSCAEHLKDEEKQWHKNYWANFYRDITVKSKDWKYEKEYRLILASSFNDYTEKNKRILRYDFKSLAGLIFGINTTKSDKLAIISIIEKKCKEIGRNNFKFCQAYYSTEKKNIDYYEMNLLKFKRVE